MKIACDKIVDGWDAFANEHAGKKVLVQASLFSKTGALATITHEGLEVSRFSLKNNTSNGGDLLLSVHPSSAVGLLFSYSPKKMSDKKMITLTGDIRLAEGLYKLSPDMLPLLQKPLEKALGPTLASNLLEKIIEAFSQFQNMRKEFRQDCIDYAMHDVAKLPTQTEALKLYAEIDALKHRIEHTEKKIT